MPDTLEGGCLCGAVRYTLQGLPASPGNVCHCRSCRRASGATSVAWFTAPADRLEVIGQPRTFASSSAVERAFCGRCGTPLFYHHEDTPETIDVTTASLDDPALLAPAREIWCEHRLPWVVADPALPQHPQDSDSLPQRPR